jgi:tetratricopeptide (TPR) repeat protein
MLPFAGVFRWLRHDAWRLTLPRICAIGLTVLAALVYVPFLANPLVFDDFNVINATDFLEYTFQFYFAPRWLPYATLAHTYALTDGGISAMRWGNLVLHATTVIAVFVLVREICLAVLDAGHLDKERESRALVAASLAAALFAVHPVAVYGAGYLVQRTIVLSTLFMLLMQIAYLRWLTSGRNALWVWSAVWYLLSMLSKEHSVMAPAVSLLLTVLIHRPSRSLARRLIPPFAVYAVTAALVISMVKGVLGAAYEPYAMNMINDLPELGGDGLRFGYPLSIVTQSFLYFKYFYLWVFPNVNGMAVDMREPFAASLLAAPYWIAALAFLCYPLMATGMVLRGGRIGIAGWVLAYPWLMFATELSTVRVQEPFVLYRAYLWFPVFGALVALVLYRVRARVALVLGLAMVCMLAPLAWNRLHTMSDTLLLWEDAAKLLVRGNESGAGRIYYNRALALSAKGHNGDALMDMDRVVRLHPRLAPVFHTRARVKFELKRYTEAMEDLDASITLNPNRAAVYFARAITLKRLGRENEALQDLRKSCDMKYVIACFAAQQDGVAGAAKVR